MTAIQGVRNPVRGFRALGVFFLSGGVLGLLGVTLPTWADLDKQLMLVPTVAGLLGGPAMLVLARRLPAWTCHPLLAFGTLVVSFGVAWSGVPAASATYTLFLVWVVVYAAYFFHPRPALAHLAFVAVCAGWALAFSSPDPAVAQTVIVVGVLVVTWLVASWLVRELEAGYRQLYEGELAVVARLEEAERVKDTLLAVTSHELRTPLTSIIGFVRTLQQRGDQLSDEDRARFLERVAAQSERMTQLVENLLLASGVTQPAPGATAVVGDVARAVAEGLTPEGPAGALRVHCPDGLLAAVTPEALWHILANLCGNAVKFARDGTAVEIRAELVGAEVSIDVVNEGTTIPPADRERIFEPFVQLGADLGERPQGMGMGLHVARRLAEAHGGSISMNGDTVGSCFRVRLPAVGYRAQ